MSNCDSVRAITVLDLGHKKNCHEQLLIPRGHFDMAKLWSLRINQFVYE